MKPLPIFTDYTEGEGWYISDTLRCGPLAASYKTSADILVEYGLTNDVENFVIAPAAYLYRHAVELILKERLQKHLSSEELVKITHNIAKLLSTLQEYEALPEDVWKIIIELWAISPSSTEFRYSDTKAELLQGDHLLFLNLKNLSSNIQLVFDHFYLKS